MIDLHVLYDKIANLNGNWPAEFNLIKVAEELGEVSAAFLKINGRKPRKGKGHAALRADLTGEMGDLLVTVLALANSLNISLDLLLEEAESGVRRWRKATEAAAYDHPDHLETP